MTEKERLIFKACVYQSICLMNPSSIFLRNDSTLVYEKSMEATCYWKQV